MATEQEIIDFMEEAFEVGSKIDVELAIIPESVAELYKKILNKNNAKVKSSTGG